eukprot:CAMPEP_0173202746 /NCGR_PEP_ID=MMETSP1141-20130122/19139_1 /TAXON_ID=483371 /ORGANISM="non described non described, Strain CCMP2298" /LENGTH=191 /DNA_ID=CAMNT_0014128135 /DNA_START=65 /DNA_END=640 /DNA_ORIENTATION=-
MEYIPDGLTKKQWAAIQAEQAEEKKKKGDMANMGTKRFKSRSFEAWQKAGGKHLFPVDPTTTSYEERPYMQRKNGDWEGNDLVTKGLAGKGQGSASKRLQLDNVYEKAKAEGKLDSPSIFGGMSLPWTNAQADKLNNSKEKDSKKQPAALASKKLSEAELKRLKANLFKPIKTEPKLVSEAPKKKGFFGLF